MVTDAQARAIGRMIGQPEVAEKIISGELNARESAPLAAGIIEGVVRELFLPLVKAESWSGFEASSQPLRGEVVLKDGTVLLIMIGERA